jgi:anti-sigma B factor antagonist
MDIEKKGDEKARAFAVSGRLDTTTAPELEAAINAVTGEAQSLKLDISEVDYVSSAGLRVILAAHKTMSSKGGLTVSGAKPEIMEVFEMTGFSDILNIE